MAKREIPTVKMSNKAIAAMQSFQERTSRTLNVPEKKGYRLAALKPWHCQAMQLIVLSGLSPSGAAARLKKNATTLNNVLSTDLAKQYMADLAKSVDVETIRGEIKSLWVKSIGIIRDTLNSDDSDLKIKKIDIATKMLEWMGVEEPTAQKVIHQHQIHDAINKAIRDTAVKKEKERSGTA